MPELPEVETVRRGLEESLLGQRISRLITKRNDLRFPIPTDIKSKTEKKAIISISRKAKFLLIELEDSTIILSHLGMSGRWTIISEDLKSTPEDSHTGDDRDRRGPHDWVILEFENGTEAVYSDPRRFGFIDVIDPGNERFHPMLEKPDLIPCRIRLPQTYSTNLSLEGRRL